MHIRYLVLYFYYLIFISMVSFFFFFFSSRRRHTRLQGDWSSDVCSSDLARDGTQLARYDRLVDDSFIMRDLYCTRNMRLAFKDGLYIGGVKAAVMTATEIGRASCRGRG